MSLTPREIRDVLDILANSAWDEAVVTVGEVTIAVARNGASLPGAPTVPSTDARPAPPGSPPLAPAPAAAPAPPAQDAPSASAPVSEGTLVTAPSVGVFWRAPEPGAAPFVEAGQRVEVGQELCIVEVMKLMNRVPAPVAGVLTAVHVANGDAVEFGTALFSIAAESSSR